MGNWQEVLSYPEEDRLAFFYHVALAEGCHVDWSSGRIWRET